MLTMILDWVHLVLRWFHVVAGITWIGQTHLFNRLEKWMGEDPQPAEGNMAGSLWMVHGGGFYHLEKQRKPVLMPEKLREFKWQSGLTWISGFLLLLLLFYYEGALSPEIDPTYAMIIGLAVVLLAWPAYALFWRSPLGKNEPVGVAICFAATVGIAYMLSQFFGGRAMYLHIGSMFGTIMAGNVWLTIIPSQKELVDSIKSGREPDMTLAARAKQCSRHNTYMSIPLIFMMISAHFPNITYGTTYSWQVLAALIIVGWVAAKIVRG